MSILKLDAKSLLQSFLITASISILFQPLAKADDNFSLMPDDIIEIIFASLADKDITAWGRLQTTSKRFYKLKEKSLAKALTKFGVTLEDNSKAFIDHVIRDNRIPEIASFNSSEAFTYFLAKAPVNRLKALWRDETFLALQLNREPSYLSQISQTKGIILSSFMAGKTGQALTKQDLIRTAYSLLLSLSGFEAIAFGAAGSAAGGAARDAAGGPARDAAYGAPWNTAWHAADSAARAAAEHAARAAARAAAEAAVWKVAWNATVCANGGITESEISSRNLTEPQAIGRLIYRVAEKVSLLYFLKEADRILEVSFQAAYDSLPTNIDDEKNIFSSTESWEAFKTTHFRHLSAAQFEFLNPWLLELDKLVAAIACN